MALHNEIEFENEICHYLGQHGWLYNEGDAASYDRTRALFPPDVIDWIKVSQPKVWETLEKSHASKAVDVVLDGLRATLNSKGTLDVIRHGIDLVGLRQTLPMAQFKPASTIVPEIVATYNANRLRVIRQVRYSQYNQNCIDLVLFLNGIPVATVELKTDFTQSIEDAVDQYRFDRHPKPKGQGTSEPLLNFPFGALVHFAVSNSEVRMATKLAGPQTVFLPFNQGNSGQAGNPTDCGGHPTAYLWEQIWERESWLEIIGRFLITQRNKKKQISGTIFPRYHQLDVTRKLVQSVLAEGPGGEYLPHRFHYSGKYLIQHSAGSGKTNSIAWTAHFLAELHRGDEKLFDSVVVVSDRNVLDAQLQEAIFSFQRTTGVVATITSDSGAKSAQLAKALAGDKKIVICTIQTFPFAMQEIQNLTATKGKRFAVIADEAHSSQSGEAASKLKKVLSAEELRDLADGGGISAEDVTVASAEDQKANSVTFVAFTATPKAKTMELFGRPPDQRRATSDDNKPAPFHVYSMLQAIQEGFILDVLKNYTPYSLAFKLSQIGEHGDGTEVDEAQAKKSLIRWVKLHEFNISQKVQVIVEHFRKNVAPLLEGKAKAMVVLSSRLEAVRWKLAIDKYITEKGYGKELGTLAAFSGEVNDHESGPDPFTEKSSNLNPKLGGRDIRDAFATDEFQILLVANKFQTGFDQPLLCGMYVDKRLAGIQAVQTLSRLNRAYPGKDTTYVLDFVNDPEEILEAFKMYQATAELESVTDPQTLFDLKNKLDGHGFYSDNEVERVVNVLNDPNSKQSELINALEPVASRIMGQHNEASSRLKAAKLLHDSDEEKDASDEISTLVLFKKDMGSYARLFSFLSQIFDYGNPVMEHRFLFFKQLIPLLEFGRERETIDFSKVTLTHYRLRDKGNRSLPIDHGDPSLIPGEGKSGTGKPHDPERKFLEEIIERVNDLFKGELTDDDKLVYVNRVIKGKLLESDLLGKQAVNNTREQFANSPNLAEAIKNAIMEALDAHTSMSKQALESQEVQDGLKDILLGPAQLWETLRGKYGDGAPPPT